MPVSRHIPGSRGPALAVATLLLLAPVFVDGLLCPLPEPSSSPADIDQYVSVCAMCSHNEAAVRWIRAEKDHISFRVFSIRYECYDAQGDVLIPKDYSEDDGQDCPWFGTIYPIGHGYLNFGTASVGQELSNGTRCEFELFYRLKIRGGVVRNRTKRSSCTVGAGCEGDRCSIDRVCTFSNGTQGVEEGLCTECSCAEGYSGTTCANVNECTAGSNTCDDNAECHDTDGSYWCQCLPGFQGDGYNCTDIDECLNVTCGENAECLNTEGNYSCRCRSGFTGDGYSCSDVDECLTEELCPSNSQCKNSPGSYSCECEAGLTMDGNTCTDIDECETGPNICSENAACFNGFGSYECHCLPGFSGDAHNCTDIDECSGGGGGDGDVCTADPNTVCHNTVGNYTCECREGYYRGSNGTCHRGSSSRAALLVTIAASALILALIVVLLPILLSMRILRRKVITFEDLTKQEIDPFYSPNFLGLSLMSIHSEYECLHQLKSSNSSQHTEQLLDNENTTADKAHPDSSNTRTPDVQQENEKCERRETVLPEEEDSSKQCVSGNDNPLTWSDSHKRLQEVHNGIEDESISETFPSTLALSGPQEQGFDNPPSTVSQPPPEGGAEEREVPQPTNKQEKSESENIFATSVIQGELSVVGPQMREEKDSCFSEFSPSTSALSAPDGKGFDDPQSSVFQPTPQDKQIESESDHIFSAGVMQDENDSCFSEISLSTSALSGPPPHGQGFDEQQSCASYPAATGGEEEKGEVEQQPLDEQEKSKYNNHIDVAKGEDLKRYMNYDPADDSCIFSVGMMNNV